MCEQMKLLRAGLDERKIPWQDQSEDGICPMERTKFEINGFSWSVIHGYGSYGGFFPGSRDAGLLEVMTSAYNGGDPVGWLMAGQVLQMIDELQEENHAKVY